MNDPPKLRALTTPTPPNADRQQLIEAQIAERRANIERFIARLEAEGDWRQVRLWKQEWLNVPQQIARDFQ